MSAWHGNFVWCELMTTDMAAATDFYSRVIGWEAKDSGATHMQYTLLNAGSAGVGGVMELPQAVRENGGQPCWTGYIWADDVDATAARVQAAGGQVHKPASDIPNVGRFAVVADPQGAVFTLFKGMNAEEAPPPAGATPGRVGWHELHARDWRAAFDFYAGLFGWTKDSEFDMGAPGIYQLFATNGTRAGGMWSNAAAPHPFWLYYFNVDGIDAAVARAQQAGGQVRQGPMEVPGGSWIAQCSDPQGAKFAMVAPKR